MLRKVETTSTTRAIRGVKQNKARKIEMETNLPQTERLEVLSKSKKDRESRVNPTTSKATRGVEQTKARKIETETYVYNEQSDYRRQLVNNEKCNLPAP